MIVEKDFIRKGNEKISYVLHTPGNDKKGTVVFCHGFGSDKEGSYEERCNFFAKNGYKAVRFDFRGNNESSLDFKEATITTRIQDLKTIIEELGESPLMVYGSSMGGFVAIHTAIEREDIECMFLRSPVTYQETLEKIKISIREKGFFEQLPGKKVGEKFLRDIESYNTNKAVSKLKIPTMIVHGSEDEVIPIKYSKKFYKNIDTVKDFSTLEGQGHRLEDHADQKALNLALKWFEESCNSS